MGGGSEGVCCWYIEDSAWLHARKTTCLGATKDLDCVLIWPMTSSVYWKQSPNLPIIIKSKCPEGDYTGDTNCVRWSGTRASSALCFVLHSQRHSADCSLVTRTWLVWYQNPLSLCSTRRFWIKWLWEHRYFKSPSHWLISVPYLATDRICMSFLFGKKSTSARSYSGISNSYSWWQFHTL